MVCDPCVSQALAANWSQLVDGLFSFTLSTFSRYYPEGNVTTVFEQDDDTKSWGGANSKLGGGVSLYACMCL